MSVVKGRYRHYKGKLYEVIDIAIHSETLEEMVVYRTLYTNDAGEFTTWVRPLSMFVETVNVSGQSIPRFKHIQEEQ
jgi:hypothetical protein